MKNIVAIANGSEIAIRERILTIRGVQVILDRDLAALHAEDVAKFNQQYGDTLVEKTTDEFHDRYLIIDRATLIHVGASLNCLGKRCFAFSTLEPRIIPDIMAHI